MGGPNIYWHEKVFQLTLIPGTEAETVLNQIVAIYRAIGFDPPFAVVRKGKVIIAYDYEDIAKEVVDLLGKQLEPQPVALNELKEKYAKQRVGPSTQALINSARARNIPCRQINSLLPDLLQFGYGVKQKRCDAATTSFTRAIAEGIAKDKNMTKIMLKSVGVPHAEGYVVTSEEELISCYAKFFQTCSVVVKPDNGRQGNGVSVNITEE